MGPGNDTTYVVSVLFTESLNTFIYAAGFDYLGLQTTGSLLTFQTGGNNTLCVTITIIDDDNIEPAESFSIRFAQAGSNIPVFAATTTVVILDQDQGTFFMYVCLYTVSCTATLAGSLTVN